MGTTITTTDVVGVRACVRTSAATPMFAVRSRAHAGTPAVLTGELRPETALVVRDDVFAPFPGTGVPGGPPA